VTTTRWSATPLRAIMVLSALLLLTLADPQTAEAQCAMCRRALQSPEGRALAGAFRGGILFLLVAPFAVFGVVAMLAVRRFHPSR
jgi:hypothetical protein